MTNKQMMEIKGVDDEAVQDIVDYVWNILQEVKLDGIEI